MNTLKPREFNPYSAFGCTVMFEGKRIVASAGSPKDAQFIAREMNAHAIQITACSCLPYYRDNEDRPRTPFHESSREACIVKGVFLTGALPRVASAA